ncbi:hypothetical protein GGR92_004679 [Spirosoma lacussanchae]
MASRIGMVTTSTVACANSLDLFSFGEAAEAGDRGFMDRQLKQGVVVILEAGTWYTLLKEYPGWLFIEVTATGKRYYINHNSAPPNSDHPLSWI